MSDRENTQEEIQAKLHSKLDSALIFIVKVSAAIVVLSIFGYWIVCLAHLAVDNLNNVPTCQSTCPKVG